MYSYIYIYLETLCMYDFTNRCFKPGWKMEVTRDIFPAQAGDLEAAHKWLPCMLGCSNRTRALQLSLKSFVFIHNSYD